MPNAAAIYARISSDPEGDQLGVTRQVQDCLALAQRRGWPVVDTYVDDDQSAYSGKPRPEYRRLLADISGGAVDAVVVWHLDRLHRQPRELEAFLDVCDAAQVKHLASVTGDVDLGTDDGRFMARILGAVARKASDDMSRRISRKNLESALAGKPAGAGKRYGYQADRATIEPTEAGVIREAAARVIAGDSLRSVAGDLTERGYLSATGKAWSLQSLRRMLMNPTISGQRTYRGEIVAKGQWDAILTPGQTAQLHGILGNPDRLTRRTVRRYLLTGGLLKCSICGASLVARPRDDGRRRYVCAKGPGLSGCGGIAIVADVLEAFIVEAILYRLDTPEMAAGLAGTSAIDQEGADLGDALARDVSQLEELATAYGERAITLAEYLAARKPIEARIDAAKRRRSRITRTAAVDPYVGDSAALRTAWADLPLPRQRAIVAAVLDRAVISPAVRGRNFFDPRRIEPVWRV
jgi:site-specific DNA recombinase